MRTQYLMQLHQKALNYLDLIDRAEHRQQKKSEQAAATYLSWQEQPLWASFPKLVDEARAEAANAPKVVARLRKAYARIMDKINSAAMSNLIS